MLIETEFLEVIAFSRKKIFFSKTLWPVKRKWLHVLWPAWWQRRTLLISCPVVTARWQHGYSAADGRTQFSTNLCGSAEKSLFFFHCTWTLEQTEINITLFLYSQASKGQVWRVKCHSKLISYIHKYKNKGVIIFYSHKRACMQNTNSRYDYRTFARCKNTLTLFSLSYGKDKGQIMH